MTRLGLTLFPLMACLACTSHAPTKGAKLDQSYLTVGGHWNDGAIVTVMAQAVNRQGRLAICGAWTAREQSVLTNNLHDRIVQAGVVFVDGKRVIDNLQFMQELSFAEDLRGKAANCVVTDRNWRPGDAEKLKIRLPRQKFGSGGFGDDGEPVLKFREGPVPSLLGQEVDA
ncbi:MAG: hypothetical protein AAGC81_07165 [Pseudomonadota bacterium]